MENIESPTKLAHSFILRYQTDKDRCITLPIRVEDFAKKQGLDTLYEPLNASVAGILVRAHHNDPLTVVINANDSMSMQRFTLAHILGRALIQQINENPAPVAQVIMRKDTNLKSKNEINRWANTFACRLLVPKHPLCALRAHRMKRQELADQFRVPKHIVVYRCRQLHLH